MHQYQVNHSAPATILPRDAFAGIGHAIVENLISRGHEVQAASVNPTHSHQLVWVPNDWDEIKIIMGWAKRFATRAARERFPSLREIEIWAEGESIKQVKDESHRANTRDYILFKQGSDAWTYSKENGPSW